MKDYIFGTSAEKSEILSTHKSMSIEEAEKQLKNYSLVSKFNDDSWVIDKKNSDKNENIYNKLNFKKIKNVNCKNELKTWIITLLMRRLSFSTIKTKLSSIKYFYEFADKNLNSFKNVSRKSILSFYDFVIEKNESLSKRAHIEHWKNVQQFFKEIKNLEACKIMNKFDVKYEEININDEKYISEEIGKKLDVIMNKDNVPIPIKTVYWILRLIPNRITEVLSMTDKCLKRIDENTYMLSIPTFKQSGQYYKGSVKLVEIKYEGTGKFLIDLIKEQLDYINNTKIENYTGFLFYSPIYRISRDEKNNTCKYRIHIKELSLLDTTRVNRMFQRICEAYNLTNEEGEIVHITTHMFRHNAITDRITSGIFRPIDIMPLTAHHNTAMIEKSYTHFKPEDLRIEENTILFNGKIINTDNVKLVEQLQKRPFAYNIEGLGICSDIRGCDKNKFECYRCPYMIPDFNQLERYKMEQEEFKRKKEKSDLIGNAAFSEKCEYWIESYEIIIRRILKAISDENLEIEEGEE